MSDTPPPEITSELVGEYLPLELIENILSRLPVKSLKRFRAVEKSWCYLIDSERFAKIHLHSSSNRNLVSGGLGFRWTSVDSPVDEAHSVKLDFGYNHDDIHSISNSCNGLVVVTRDPQPPVLLNPFSREYKVLPKCPLQILSESSSLYGFGYDSRNDDYKVVKILSLGQSVSMYLTYSLRLDCWRITKGTSFFRETWPAHVNGVLHSIGGDETGHLKIMGFSVETEDDHEVARPERIDMIMKGMVGVRLDELGGSLALLCSYGSEFVLWVMEEYGVKESWTPLASFPFEAEQFVRPLAYSKERYEVMLNCDGKRLAWWDVRRRRKSVEKVVMPAAMVWPWLCVESLVSPNGRVVEKGSTQKHNKNKEKKEVKKKKNNKKMDGFLSAGFKLVL